MKKKIAQYAAACLFTLISLGAYSQSNDHSVPAWVSDDGYWVVENNVHQPRHYTVRFYNNDHVMIGSQEIDGKKMNMKRKKVKMQLKSMLETSLVAWNRENPAAAKKDVAKKP